MDHLSLIDFENMQRLCYRCAQTRVEYTSLSETVFHKRYFNSKEVTQVHISFYGPPFI